MSGVIVARIGGLLRFLRHHPFLQRVVPLSDRLAEDFRLGMIFRVEGRAGRAVLVYGVFGLRMPHPSPIRGRRAPPSFAPGGAWRRAMRVDLRSAGGASEARPGRAASPGDRQLELLRLVGDQGAVPSSQFARFANLGRDAAERVVDGFVAAGWVDRRRFLAGDEDWIWLCPRGARVAGVVGLTRGPAPAALDHLRAINEVRLLVEGQAPDGRWLSERSVRVGVRRSFHFPDAVFEFAGQRHAIEVELTPKSKRRLRETVAELCARYDSVVYFCSEPVRALLARLGGQALFPKLVVRDLPGERGWSLRGRSLASGQASGPTTPGLFAVGISDPGVFKEMLSLLAEQGPISLDHLGRFLGRSEEETTALVAHAVADGLLQRGDALYGESPWVWPTSAGMRRCGSDLSVPKPRLGGAPLARATNEARLFVTERAEGMVWVSRRRLLRIHGRGAVVPRGVVEYGAERFAVEVELRLPRDDQLVARYELRRSRFDAVVVFCSGAVLGRLEVLARDRGWSNLEVRELPVPGVSSRSGVRSGSRRRRRGRPPVERSTMEQVEAQALARMGVPDGQLEGLSGLFGEEVRSRLEAARRGPSVRLRMAELARLTRLGEGAIRVYQRLGVVRPPCFEGRAGYYDAEHRETVEIICDLRERGLSRSAIRDLFVACRGRPGVGLDERLDESEFCRRLEISRSALRRFVTQGVLQPPHSSEGAEYFGSAHAVRLRVVRDLQAAGFRVPEISSWFQERADAQADD